MPGDGAQLFQCFCNALRPLAVPFFFLGKFSFSASQVLLPCGRKRTVSLRCSSFYVHFSSRRGRTTRITSRNCHSSIQSGCCCCSLPACRIATPRRTIEVNIKHFKWRLNIPEPLLYDHETCVYRGSAFADISQTFVHENLLHFCDVDEMTPRLSRWTLSRSRSLSCGREISCRSLSLFFF